MAPDTSKAAARRSVEQGLADAEAAIRTHDERTFRIYENAARAFRAGQDEDAAGIDLPQETLDDAKLSRNYLLAMAFMSAWWHRHGDTAQRDKAAQAAATVASTLGFDRQRTFDQLLKLEHRFREDLSREGIGRSGKLGCLPLVFVGLALAALWVR